MGQQVIQFLLLKYMKLFVTNDAPAGFAVGGSFVRCSRLKQTYMF